MENGPGDLDENNTVPTATDRATKPGRLSLTAVIGAVFGSLVIISVLVILFLAVAANRENTFSLLNDKAVLITQSLENQMRDHLDSVAEAIVALKRMFEKGELSENDFDKIRLAFSGALLANSSISVLVLTDLDKNESGLYRGPENRIWRFQRQSSPQIANRYAQPKLEVGSPPTWGPLVQTQGGYYANISVPLERDGALVGYLTAALATEEVAKGVRRLDNGEDETVFVISDDDAVIAHSDLEALGYKGEMPARIADLADPVLGLLNETPVLPIFQEAEKSGVDVRRIETPADGATFIAMTAKLEGYGPSPWIVGEYFRAASISREVERLRGSIIAGLSAAGIAFLLALFLARRFARPLREVAIRARYIGALEFDQVEALPRSKIRELDQAAIAFNSMVVGLRAMNTYVPRSLFRKLMRLGLGGATKAREAELTIIFTDIAGFTALSEKMSATQTANILNAHFALLVSAVEEEGGTVDKFLGDGMLAFWGAPDERPDHAAAAVRACFRIAAAQQAANIHAIAQGLPPLRLRIGIHTGLAVAGNVGAHDRWNYTVVGDAVNVCERLQNLGHKIGPDDEIVVLASAETIAQVPGIACIEPAGKHRLRGRKTQMEVWRIDVDAESGEGKMGELIAPEGVI